VLKWLFRKELKIIADMEEKLVEWEKRFAQTVTANTRAAEHVRNAAQDLRKAEKIVADIVEVGVDHYPVGESWAVLCIDGKQTHVRFARMDRSSIMELSRFLKPFERVHFDGAPGMKEMFWGLKDE